MMPINETPNRLDALRGNAEIAGGPPAMGGTTPLPLTASPASAPPMSPPMEEDPMIGEDPMEIAANMAPEELASGVANSVLTASSSPEEALAIVESAADELRALVQQGSGEDAGRIEDMLAGLV